MSKAIITGATGFIGSNLCKYLLEKKWEVAIIVRNKSNLNNIISIIDKIEIFEYNGNVEELINFLKKTKADVVYHLASLVIVEHEYNQINELLESNITFGVHILESMKESKTKLMINTGTFWQNYHTEEYNPVNLYAATKQAFEDLIKYYTEAENIRVITLKLFDTYGTNDSRSKVINLLYQYADKPNELNMSPGEQVLDLVHVSDVLRAYEIAYKHLNDNKDIKFDEFGVFTGREIKLKQLVDIFESVTNKKINVNWGGRSYRKREVMYLGKKYNILPGWTPEIILEEGLKK